MAHYNVGCFSRTADDLGQWRAYGENGSRYALGFSASELVDAFLRGNEGVGSPATFPVIYDNDLLGSLQVRAIEDAFPLLNTPQSGMSVAERRDFEMHLISELTVNAMNIALNFKHGAYENEAEFRLLVINDGTKPLPNGKWIKRPHQLSKVIEFDWRTISPAAVKEIIIGPSADLRLAERFVADCCEAYYPRSVSVRNSSIPYR
jgi:hypothetical protein